jgi:hypothetical protein
MNILNTKEKLDQYFQDSILFLEKKPNEILMKLSSEGVGIEMIDKLAR